jgi:uncharacterized protein
MGDICHKSEGRGHSGTAAGLPGYLCSLRDRTEYCDYTDEGERNMNLDYPFHFDGHGRTATTDLRDHIRDMIEELLFTNHGERVNRPDYGSGILRSIFAPNSRELASELERSAQGALNSYLGDLIIIKELIVTSENETLSILIQYIIRSSGEGVTDSFKEVLA